MNKAAYFISNFQSLREATVTPEAPLPSLDCIYPIVDEPPVRRAISCAFSIRISGVQALHHFRYACKFSSLLNIIPHD